ncbi:MAG: hypothetical protein ACOYY2_08450 [Actinomycetota bacterium]
MSGAPTTGFTLVTPATWYRFDLAGRPALLHRRRLRRLVADRLGPDPPRPGRPQLAEEVTDLLRASIAEAQAQGAVHLAVCADLVGGLPVSASMLVHVRDRSADPTGGDLARLADALGRDAEVVALPTGPAVRHRHRGAPAPGGHPVQVLESEVVQYHLPLPGGDRWLMLTFSTPCLPVAEALVELFDAIAGTVRWQHGPG